MKTRMLHTMIRVGDLDRSIKFYTQVLGMTLLRHTDRPEQAYTLAFLGYEHDKTYIELTYNYGIENYDLGTGFGHIALACENIDQLCDTVIQAGYTVSRAPGPIKGGTTRIAFIVDPDGYKIELIEKFYD